ncbi:MAG: hypothetical protein WKF84_27805 [Pyrinomonadaceae bacterium]
MHRALQNGLYTQLASSREGIVVLISVFEYGARWSNSEVLKTAEFRNGGVGDAYAEVLIPILGAYCLKRKNCN